MSTSTERLNKKYIDLLTQEEEIALFQQWQKARKDSNSNLEQRLYDKIITQYAPIVHKTVRNLANYGLDEDDLTAEGFLALASAAQRFDISKGFRFSTFARLWVRGLLLMYVSRNYFMIDYCRRSTNKQLFFGIRRMMSQITADNINGLPSQAQLESAAAHFGCSVEDVESMMYILGSPVTSLNATVTTTSDDVGVELIELLVDERNTPLDNAVNNEREAIFTDIIKEAAGTLTDRERDILVGQLGSHERVRLETLSQKYGVSRERIRQIRNETEKKFRNLAQRAIKKRGLELSELF